MSEPAEETKGHTGATATCPKGIDSKLTEAGAAAAALAVTILGPIAAQAASAIERKVADADANRERVKGALQRGIRLTNHRFSI